MKKKSIRKKQFDILDIAGKYKVRKNSGKSALKAREAMEKHYKRI